jgi:hypothetical protein
MIKKELHLVIVWDAAKDAYNKIIEVIDEKFTIKEVYEITWDKEVFIKNLISFYSQSQSHLNKRQTNKLFKGKAKYCGIAPFKLIIFEDNNPNYQLRKTSSGYRKVNLNVFDLKLQFRELTGGGHKIHGTDSVKETNKDLTLLLGDNIIDFYKKHNGNWDKKVKILNRNITGSNGYRSLKELFYVLNASTEYVVLRNFESFPDSYISKEHGDIDMLVENLNLIVYLTEAKKVFNKTNRVHYTIKIKGEDVPFDFRYVGDGYYDEEWEKEILATKELNKGIFYSPNKANLFYSLLYHALIHKQKLSADYINKISLLAKQIDVELNSVINDKDSLMILDKLMNHHGYKYTVPIDNSVYVRYKLRNNLLKLSIWRKLLYLIVDVRILLSVYKNRIIR